MGTGQLRDPRLAYLLWTKHFIKHPALDVADGSPVIRWYKKHDGHIIYRYATADSGWGKRYLADSGYWHILSPGGAVLYTCHDQPYGTPPADGWKVPTAFSRCPRCGW